MHRWGSILSKIGNDAKSPSRTTSNQSKSCLLLSIQPATSPFLDSLLSVPGLSFSLSHPFLFLYFSLSPQKRALPPSRFFLSLSLSLSSLSLFQSVNVVQVPSSLLNRAIQRGRPFARFLFPGAEPGRTGSARIWVSGADNLQRKIEWSTPIIVVARAYLCSSATLQIPKRRRCRQQSTIGCLPPLRRFVIVITGVPNEARRSLEYGSTLASLIRHFSASHLPTFPHSKLHRIFSSASFSLFN